TALSAYTPAQVDVNTNGNDKEDSDDHTGVTAIPTQGLTDTSALDPETDEQTIASYDFGFVPASILGAIGNYVWLDENADGQQDEGERGVPNVIVNMVDDSGTVYTTTTDTDGGYLFPDLPAGTYTVNVAASNFAPGGALEDLEQTPLGGGDADFGNKDDAGYAIVLGEGEENLTADFGYNPDPEDTNNNENLAALGDYVWIDSDGDGAQDAGETPVEGVVLTLFNDPDGDGIYDTVVATDTTDATGYYLFDTLPAGGYKVTVTDSSGASHDILGADYTQTGDPDHFGSTDVTVAANDGQTTVPVILGPGDVFLNADFGYNAGGSCHQLGDLIFFDEAANGTFDGSD
ncbi:MAG: carboxypeptidase regulatory-like domain-containing protein, partial [Methylococcales bacterium]|nr:carboxypeptidase regulatory-like domain-containing protein [Methylococcales bacterium]